eukprot:1125375-Pleurochrysis_carterae.AAC.1
MYSYDGRSSPPAKLVEFLENNPFLPRRSDTSVFRLTHNHDSKTDRSTCSHQGQSSSGTTSTAAGMLAWHD